MTYLYSDTDSILHSDKLPDHLIGGGIRHDERRIGGETLERLTVLGIKQYGYRIVDKSRNSK